MGCSSRPCRIRSRRPARCAAPIPPSEPGSSAPRPPVRSGAARPPAVDAWRPQSSCVLRALARATVTPKKRPGRRGPGAPVRAAHRPTSTSTTDPGRSALLGTATPGVEAVEAGSQDGVELQRVSPATYAQQALYDEPQEQPGARRVDAPAALQWHRSARNVGVVLRGIGAVGEDCVRTRVVAGGLARASDRYPIGQPEWDRQQQAVPQPPRLADPGERLAIAQVGVGIHQADLPTPESCCLRTLEDHHRTATIGRRLVEQPGAVGPPEVSVEQVEMVARLLKSELIPRDGVDLSL